MYLRFVISQRDETTGAATGIFQPAIAIKYREIFTYDWLLAEVTAQIAWFNVNLNAPARMARSGGRRGNVYGVCWFRPRATAAIGHARYLAWLLEEAGIPVSCLRRQNPGELIWQDEQQVVAKPPRDLLIKSQA